VLPQRFSHPVRQYDEPELSIVIPVGPCHEDDLRTALDSIEAQHFRNWEVIAVLDTGNEHYPELYAAYPYVKWAITDGKRGAGYARNQGAEMAKGKFLLFVDADDFFNPAEPNALGEMLERFWETGNGVYSAHIGRAVVSSAYADKMKAENRLAAWNEQLGQAYIHNNGVDYNCEDAIREPRDHPDGKFYIWNLISTLIPRQWHFDIGGFDETMTTWEDWDYWLRMAKMGRCFTRIQKPFLIYNYISGTRREAGLQKGTQVLQYLIEKHNKVEIMACGCGGNKKAGVIVAEADGYVMATYIWGNKGRHDVGWGLGRHVGGGVESFLVPADVVKNNPHKFAPVQETIADPTPQPEQMAAPKPFTSPDGSISWTTDELIDMSDLSQYVRTQLKDADLRAKETIKATGEEGLVLLKGIGPATAKKIMELAE
jgi:glycosyltransferase involved in cell wall biosynthesis